MNRLTVIVIAVVAALAVSGCKKNEAKEPTTTYPIAAEPTPAEPATPPEPAEPAEPATPAEPVTPVATATMTDAEFEALMQKAVAMFTAMGDATDRSGSDCTKLGKALEKVIADNKAFIDEAKKYKDNPDMDRRAEVWMKDHQDEVMGPMMKVASAGQKCSSDPAFMRAMEKLGEL